MAFTKVEKLRTGGHGEREPLVTMAAYLADGKAHNTKSIAFRITRALVNQLGWTATDGKLHITINEGTGDDKGFLQLVADQYGRRTSLSDDNKGVGLSISIQSFKHYVLNECPVPMNVATHIVDGNALIIECPDWLRYNPQSVLEEKKPTPVTQLHRRGRRT